MSNIMSRRTFLGRASLLAGATAVGPSIVPSSVLGLDGAVAPSNRIGLGFIGQGGRGKESHPDFSELARKRLPCATSGPTGLTLRNNDSAPRMPIPISGNCWHVPTLTPW